MMDILIPKSCRYLSDFISELPSNCLIDKGITGCGGTTLEINTPRNSIILSPTKSLVYSKQSDKVLGVTGDTRTKSITEYLKSDIPYKKIIVTYDSIERVKKQVKNYQDYFLLVDEYHLLFNDYAFRNEAVRKVLKNFRGFSNWAFLTATPIKDEFIIKELKDIPKISYKWEGAVPVNIQIRDTYFVQKELIDLIESTTDKNLHIFLNSITTINHLVKKITKDYRIVCSDASKSKVKNFARTTDPIKPVNFYTSCAFEGCDVYDPVGYCVIVSDTAIATTVLDISTKIKQVCGRIRNSVYNDQCLLILNTTKHRYADVTPEQFNKTVKQSEEKGKDYLRPFETMTEAEYQAHLDAFNQMACFSMYVNKDESHVFFDENLKNLDIYNYHLFSEIYNTSISVLKEAKSEGFKIEEVPIKKGLTWIGQKLKDLNRIEYTYQELESIFKPLFKEHFLQWSAKGISKYFPEHTKKRKMIKGIQSTYYKFTI